MIQINFLNYFLSNIVILPSENFIFHMELNKLELLRLNS